MSEDYYKWIQEGLDKEVIEIIDLGVINGMHRYRFIKKSEDKEHD